MPIETLQSSEPQKYVTYLQDGVLRKAPVVMTSDEVKQSYKQSAAKADVMELPASLTNKDRIILKLNPVEKPTYEFDASAVKIDLNLDFSAENLKKVLNNVIGMDKQLPAGNRDGVSKEEQKNGADFTSFLKVDLSVDAERIQKKRVSGGSGRVRDVHVHYRRRTSSRQYENRRLERIRLQIQRRQQESVDARLSIMHRNGFRIVHKRISQRYQEDLSLKAELIDKFTTLTDKVNKKQPESTGKFIDTTNKLVQNKRVSGKTVSRFFDAVESYIDKAKSTLHKKIDKFLDRIAKDFNMSEDKLDEMRTNLHNKVDGFFDKVDKVLDKLEADAIDFLGDNEGKLIEEKTISEVQENPGTVEQVA